MMRRQSLSMLSVSPLLIARLDNWGDVYRDRQKVDTSATGRFCELLARSKGQIEDARLPDDRDEQDAVIVEFAWCSQGMPTLSKLVLYSRYMIRLAPLYTQRLLRVKGISIHRREYETVEVRAHWAIANALAKVETRVYKPSHNSCTAEVAARVHPRAPLALRKAEPKRSAFA